MADFDFTADELGAVDRIPRYNERPFNADATSPAYNLWGFDNGGYLTLQMKQGRDTMLMGVAAQRFASSASSSAILAAQEAANATAERIAAQNAATDAYNSGQDAAAQVGLAAAQVALAAAQAQRFQGTSASTVFPSTAAKTFTTQAGKAFDVGTSVLVQSRGNIDRWMFGRVTAYANISLTVAVEVVGSVASAASDWDIRVSSVRGAQGLQGIPGIPTMGYRLNSSAGTELPAFKHAAYLIDFSYSGSQGMGFAAAATLGAGWYAVLRNLGPGDLTLDPNGSETIDGLTSFVMYPGETRLVQCDGTALRSVVLTPFSKTFTQSDTFVKPPGYSQFGGMIRSGGAGGGRRSGTGGDAYGGPGGGAFPFIVSASQIAASSPVTVGAGGAGQTATNVAYGNPGGDSIFAGITVKGGGSILPQQGGSILPVRATQDSAFGFEAGATVSGNKSIYGGVSVASGSGGSSVFGGGAGGSLLASSGSVTAGLSTLAGNGGSNGGGNADAGAGGVPSGGGGGANPGYLAGAGARGQVEIYGVV